MVFNERAAMLSIDNNELPIEGDSGDDNIADLLGQLQADQSDGGNQALEGATTSNRQGVKGVLDNTKNTNNTNNTGNGLVTNFPSG